MELTVEKSFIIKLDDQEMRTLLGILLADAYNYTKPHEKDIIDKLESLYTTNNI